MDPITGILCAAVAALWFQGVRAHARCEARSDRLEARINRLVDDERSDNHKAKA